MGAVYRCAECGTIAGPDDDGWITSACGCDAAIIAEASSRLAGQGGVAR